MDIEENLIIENKEINGVTITNLEISKISMICDFLVLDRFHDISSFIRFEHCFGPLFSKEEPKFLFDVYQEICGEKKKYISYGRLINAFLRWKDKKSENSNFNKFMDTVFNKMIKLKDEVVGVPEEGGKVFSTKNAKGRKIISKFSVVSDEIKNSIKGLIIQYDDVFDCNLISQKEIEPNVQLEINFKPNGLNIKDRDGISHIGGKYSKTKNIIKFLIFKCRSGKTFYIGDNSEEKDEQIELFLFGTSSCQLKSLRIELVNDQLAYFEPKFQPSLRINQKIIPFNEIDDKFIKDNIINSPLIFEESELQKIPIEKLNENNSLLVPCIKDDAFVEKDSLIEPICGKNFVEVYKSYILVKHDSLKEETEELINQIYVKTILRKHLLKVYFNKFKRKENISVLKQKNNPGDRINMDKFLAKIKNYRKKMDKKIEKKKEELKKMEIEEDDVEDEDDDWIKNDKLEKEENN